MEEYDVHGLAGEPLELPFDPGGATGYRWSLELPRGVIRVEDTAPRPTDPAARLGSSVGSRMQVVAERGEHTVTACLGVPGKEPARTIVVRLHVTRRPEG